MEMTKKELERQEFLKEGYRIFADAVNYSDDEIVGYTRLVNLINHCTRDCEDRNILISELVKALSTLNSKHQTILLSRCGLSANSSLECELYSNTPMTLNELSKIFRVYPETIRQHQESALRKMRHPSRFPMCVISNIRKRKESELVARSYSDILIKELSFSVRTFNCLLRAGISTVEDLLNFPEEKLPQIRNLGQRSLEEVIQKRRELLEKFS